MNKEILRSVLADNQVEIPRHDVIPRKFEFEGSGTMYSSEYDGQVNHICCISVSSSFFLPEQAGMKFYISTLRMSG